MPNMQSIFTNEFHKPFLLLFIFVNEVRKEDYATITFSETFSSRKKYTFEGRQTFRAKQYAVWKIHLC